MDTPLQPIPDGHADLHHDEVTASRGDAEIDAWEQRASARPRVAGRPFEPDVSALEPLFLDRLERIHVCRVGFIVDINTRPTMRVLGGYYKSRRLVRVYAHDRQEGRRPLAELFDTFLHEVAHHLEYTEPQSFSATECRRIPGQMHSHLFWRILGELRVRWARLHAQRRRAPVVKPAPPDDIDAHATSRPDSNEITSRRAPAP
jgi:hypothetical protein